MFSDFSKEILVHSQVTIIFVVSVCLFVCLFVCLSVSLLNVRVCAPDFAMKALEYRNNFDAVG